VHFRNKCQIALRKNFIGMYLHRHKEDQYCNRDKITIFAISFCTNNYKKTVYLDKEKESVNHVINLCLRIP
jgi:hypothetical protein